VLAVINLKSGFKPLRNTLSPEYSTNINERSLATINSTKAFVENT
jgi:hypothetical protein